MELWFIFAVLSAVVGGFGAFSNKIAAQRKYSSQLLLIVNSLISLMFIPLAFWFEGVPSFSWLFVSITFFAGLLGSFSAVIKIQALHHIDSAIFLPLFKVLGPLIVIIFGILFFGESFSTTEWFGLVVSMLVPILLISRVEKSRQNDLLLGLMLVLTCAVISAIVVGLQKFAVDIKGAPLWIISITSVGIFIGAMSQYTLKHKGDVFNSLVSNYSYSMFQIALLRTIFAGGGFLLTLYALSYGGPLGIVYTINSLYILPPIILAIIFYNEHWNFRKALAIVLSLLALGLLG